MNKTLWAIVIIIIILAGGFYLWTMYKSAPAVVNVPIQTPQLAADLSPLYSGAVWNAPHAETLELSTTTASGVGTESVSVNNTMDPGSVFSPFEKYYADKLSALGYKTDIYLEAGGPMGGQTGYRKGDNLIVLRFKTVFHVVTNTAPSQCPCDVTLSLFSAN